MYTLKTLLDKYEIMIPMIQRDYAQGRLSSEVTTIRESIVGKLKAATVDGVSVDMDFIYGVQKDGTLRPLDGQQRLTSLYLLYWYIGYRKGEFPEYLRRFTYETRITARDFFHALIERPIIGEAEQTIEERIRNQKWFQTKWLLDPTIAGVLVMLNKLESAFRDVETDQLPDLIHRQPNISFHFLDLDKYDLDESLYIKMNSRGKPLSPFDNFKAQFEQHLFESGMEAEWEAYKQKVEVQWVDLLWPYRDDITKTIDEVFLNIFSYWTSTIVLKKTNVKKQKDSKEFMDGLITPQRFTSIYQSNENVHELFTVFDMWKDNEELEETFAYYSSELPHIAPDLLNRLLLGKLTNTEQVLVYTIVKLKQRGSNSSDCLRVIRNLTEGIRQKSKGKYETNLRIERLGPIYAAIDEFVATEGKLSDRIENTLSSVFTSWVVQHEIKKCRYCEEHENMKEALHRLEDFDMFKGMTHRVFPAFQLYGEPFINRLKDLLETRPSLWTRAMVAIADYSVIDGYSAHSARYVFGGSRFAQLVWTNQLGNNEEETEKNLQFVLDSLAQELMEREEPIHVCLERIIDCCQLSPDDWRYYFVKYEGTLTDEGHMFTFPSEKKLIVERLAGLRLSGDFINPIYAEMKKQLGYKIESFTEYVSKLETSHGVQLFLQDAEWALQGDVDQDNLKQQIQQWSHLDRVEQGVNLVNWLNDQQRIATYQP